mmetsp:Transcript_86268/g.217104  ORF Transcript_86268/g.217104 Transcript_86268/m.217104 type:complete len:88 (-) Transcript_86268:96-359(-)
MAGGGHWSTCPHRKGNLRSRSALFAWLIFPEEKTCAVRHVAMTSIGVAWRSGYGPRGTGRQLAPCADSIWFCQRISTSGGRVDDLGR